MNRIIWLYVMTRHWRQIVVGARRGWYGTKTYRAYVQDPKTHVWYRLGTLKLAEALDVAGHSNSPVTVRSSGMGQALWGAARSYR